MPPQEENYAAALIVFFVFGVLPGVLGAILAAMFAARKNRNPWAWGIFGALFCVPTLIVMAFMPYLCPVCQTPISNKQARDGVCPNCYRSRARAKGARLPPIPPYQPFYGDEGPSQPCVRIKPPWRKRAGRKIIWTNPCFLSETADRPVAMNLFYDPRDDKLHEARESRILYWLDDLGARPLSEARSDDEGFLFASARPIDDYRNQFARTPLLRDTPEQREPLLQLDTVLDALASASPHVSTPKTWRLPLDCPLPDDLTFPLFVRTAISSWKVGGRVSRVRSASELEAESAELRRAFGWDAVILARAWHDFALAGEGIYGRIPREVRVWIVDQAPFAWSFHYMIAVNKPLGFPPNDAELNSLEALAREVGRAFGSRLVAADFAQEKNGEWTFIEAGPGSCAGCAHEAVFKAVARRVQGENVLVPSDAVGGGFARVAG